MNPSLDQSDDLNSLRGAQANTLRPLSAIAATRRGGVPEARVARIVSDLAGPLSALHRSGRIHGAISHDSIGLDAQGRADLILLPTPSLRSAGDTALRQGRASGFNAFEQYTDDPAWAVGPPTDVYALCAAVCRLITGATPPSAIDRCVHDRYIPMVQRGLEGYSPRFLAAFDQGLALRPQDRPADMAQLLIATGMSSETVQRVCQEVLVFDPRDDLGTLATTHSTGVQADDAVNAMTDGRATQPVEDRSVVDQSTNDRLTNRCTNDWSTNDRPTNDCPVSDQFTNDRSTIDPAGFSARAGATLASSVSANAAESGPSCRSGDGRKKLQRPSLLLVPVGVAAAFLGIWLWLQSNPMSRPPTSAPFSAVASPDRAGRAWASAGPALSSRPPQPGSPEAGSQAAGSHAAVSHAGVSQATVSQAASSQATPSQAAVSRATGSQPQPAAPGQGTAPVPGESIAQSSAAAPQGLPVPPTVSAVRVPLDIRPWGEVYIDGVKRGVSPPLRHLALPPGTYRVSIRNPHAQTHQYSLTIASGRTKVAIKHQFPLD